MDLSTIKTIKRRTIEIIPNQDSEYTNCSITLSNWFQGKDNSNKKFRLSSFFLNNSALPCFIPKWMSQQFPANWWGVNPGTETNATIGPNSLDYHFNLYTLSNSYCSTVLMDPIYSSFPTLAPLVHPGVEDQQLFNKYYWFFNTSQFLDMLAKQINAVILANPSLYTGGTPHGVAFVRTQNGFGLYIPKTINAKLQFSQTLIDLFQFKGKKSTNSPNYLIEIEPNAQLRNYNVEILSTPGTYSVEQCYFIASNYVPDTWFPFDLLVIKTTLPIETDEFFDNSNYTSRNYQNIMLTYKIQNDNPDGIYNFYTSTIDPLSGWNTIISTNVGDNCQFDVLLRFQRTGSLIPYQIKRGEKAYLITEEITTY